MTEDESATEEEGNLSSISDTSIGLGTTLSAHAAASGCGGGVSGNDDLLLQFQDGLVDDDALVGYGLVGVHHQGMMSMMGGSGAMGGKYGVHPHHGHSDNPGVDVVSEADYDDAVNMSLFTDSDVFFNP